MDQYTAGGLPAFASGVIDAVMLILSVVLCFVLCCVYVIQQPFYIQFNPPPALHVVSKYCKRIEKHSQRSAITPENV